MTLIMELARSEDLFVIFIYDFSLLPPTNLLRLGDTVIRVEGMDRNEQREG